VGDHECLREQQKREGELEKEGWRRITLELMVFNQVLLILDNQFIWMVYKWLQFMVYGSSSFCNF